jgi:hypothetical protein
LRVEIEIEIDKDGDAAQEIDEVNQLLGKLQTKFQWYSGMPEDGKILDLNGNSVGRWSIQ